MIVEFEFEFRKHNVKFVISGSKKNEELDDNQIIWERFFPAH